MKPKEPRTPKYRLHRPSGRAVVTINGMDQYLGRHGTPESRAEYDRVISEWLARGRRPPADETKVILLKEVIAGYFENCKRKLPQVEVDKVRDALKVVRTTYGERPAAEFNAVAFDVVRSKLVASGLCITTVRNRIFTVKKMLAWGIVREMVPDRVLNVIKAFEKEEPLRVGRAGVKPPKEVRPAPEEHIRAVLPHVPPTVAAMLMVQFYSAAARGSLPPDDRPDRHVRGDLGLPAEPS